MVGEVWVERGSGIVSLIDLHAFARIVEIDLVPLANHHRVFRRPLRVLKGGIRVRVRGHDDLAGDHD
jgi:hypothetical protein